MSREIVTAKWILEASKEDILKNKEAVFSYFKTKEEILERLKDKPKLFEESRLEYLKALAKVLECGLTWKRKF